MLLVILDSWRIRVFLFHSRPSLPCIAVRRYHILLVCLASCFEASRIHSCWWDTAESWSGLCGEFDAAGYLAWVKKRTGLEAGMFQYFVIQYFQSFSKKDQFSAKRALQAETEGLSEHKVPAAGR